jgi:hypothetical protein
MSASPQDAGTPVVTSTPAPTESDKSQVQAEETKTPDPATEGENTDGTKPTDEGEPEQPKRRDGGFQRRINRLTADYRAAQTEAEQARARISELESRLNKPAPSEDAKPPRVEDFKTYEEYERADRAFVADQASRKALREFEERQRSEAAKTEAKKEAERIQKARDRFNAAGDELADSYEGADDFIDDLSRGHTPLRDLDGDALREIFEHDDPKMGFALGLHLHMHPEEVKRIADLPRSRQVRELARLEASLPKPGAKTVTQAPEPPKRVKAGGGPDGKDPEKMTIDEMRIATKTHRIVRD